MIPPDVLSPLLAMVEAAAERGAARALAAHSAPGPAAARDVDRHELARVLGVSTATVGRLQ